MATCKTVEEVHAAARTDAEERPPISQDAADLAAIILDTAPTPAAAA